MKTIEQIFAMGTELYGCIRANMMILEQEGDVEKGSEVAKAVMDAADKYIIRNYLLLSRCIKSEELIEELSSEFRESLSSKSLIFNEIAAKHWYVLESDREEFVHRMQLACEDQWVHGPEIA